MGPGAPMPVSFLNVDEKNSKEGSMLETGPGAPVPVNFFLVNSSMTGGDEKDAKDEKKPTTSKP